MARHRRRHYRDLGAVVTVPGLGFMGKSAPLGSVVMGALIGAAAAGILKVAVSKVDALKANVPEIVQNNMPLVGGLLAGGALYYFGRKSPDKARGRAFGAVFGSLAAWGWDKLKSNAPEYFGDVVTLRYNQYGMLVNEGRSPYAGLLVDESARNLAELAAIDSMGESAESPEGVVP